jgi:hypothetical protein
LIRFHFFLFSAAMFWFKHRAAPSDTSCFKWHGPADNMPRVKQPHFQPIQERIAQRLRASTKVIAHFVRGAHNAVACGALSLAPRFSGVTARTFHAATVKDIFLGLLHCPT